LESIADLTAGKVCISTGMTREEERVKAAIEHAQKGETVAIISSGDAGVYGMAGLAIEMAHQLAPGLAIEIIPGISAANSAAAAFGAPLMLDYAVISLSDLLVSWEQIRSRLEAVAAVDMVVALYNPRSTKRVTQLEEAVAIFLKHRPPTTPVDRPWIPARARGEHAKHCHHRQHAVESHRWLLCHPPRISIMILLLGGTSETAQIAQALVKQGWEVLLSTATTMPSRGQMPANIRMRCGMLDEQGLVNLIRTEKIIAVVDATHPYAEQVSQNTYKACQTTGIRYLAYERPCVSAESVHHVPNHQAGAKLSFSFGKPVLLTIGVRNLAPYIAEARRLGIALKARVLNHPDSVTACHAAGLSASEILCADGPFTVEENRHHLKGFGVLVTKDSGEAGGVDTKIEAARLNTCEVVVIERPKRPVPGYASVEALVHALGPR
jgi:precorrin-6x reductase